MTQSNTDNSKQSSNIDFNDNQPMINQQVFLNVRSLSKDSTVAKLFGCSAQIQHRQLLIHSSSPLNPNQLPTTKHSRKIKKQSDKQKKKNQSEYCKNICGYITKKIIRQLCSPNYQTYIKQLCQKYKCQYQQAKNFYLHKIQHVTGPSHIPGLLIPDCEQQQQIKQVFTEFFQWFIKSRYLRYLLIQGKMTDKKAYIRYKNQILLSILNQNKNTKLLNDPQQHSSQSSELLSDSVDNEQQQQSNESNQKSNTIKFTNIKANPLIKKKQNINKN